MLLLFIRMWTCLLFRLFKRCNIPMVAMGTVTPKYFLTFRLTETIFFLFWILFWFSTWQFPTGLALAIEKKSRRIEISLYCLARAIESFFTCMADVGYLPSSKRLKRADVVVFSISTAIIMHCYAIERDVFRSKYLNVLDWVFGVPLPPSETPRRRKWKCRSVEIQEIFSELSVSSLQARVLRLFGLFSSIQRFSELLVSSLHERFSELSDSRTYISSSCIEIDNAKV